MIKYYLPSHIPGSSWDSTLFLHFLKGMGEVVRSLCQHLLATPHLSPHPRIPKIQHHPHSYLQVLQISGSNLGTDSCSAGQHCSH